MSALGDSANDGTRCANALPPSVERNFLLLEVDGGGSVGVGERGGWTKPLRGAGPVRWRFTRSILTRESEPPSEDFPS
jgi:hypothetical protein